MIRKPIWRTKLLPIVENVVTMPPILIFTFKFKDFSEVMMSMGLNIWQKKWRPGQKIVSQIRRIYVIDLHLLLFYRTQKPDGRPVMYIYDTFRNQ